MAEAIARSEYLDRQRRAVEAAGARGLDGLLVWSQRSNHGDVTYLTGHRTSFPEMADTPHWSGKSYSGFVLPVSGDPILVVDVPIGPGDAAVDEIRIRIDLVDAVAEALAETGLDVGALGLVGSSTLRHGTLLRLEETLGRKLDLRPADDVVMGMRLVKSPAEIALMRDAAELGAECMNLMLEAAVPGATEGDLIGLGFDFLARHGACPGSVVVASGNPCVPRGPRPNVSSWDARRRFEPGDLMRLDFSAQLGGYQTDHARSTVIGADPTPAQRKAMEDALAMITTMIDATRPGITVGQLHDVGAAWLADNGYPPYAIYGRFWPSFGHGLGLELEPPYIEADEPTVLVPGVILSIETILGTPEVGGATYEDSVLVTEAEAEALTKGDEGPLVELSAGVGRSGARLGMLTPSSNTVLEPLVAAMLAPVGVTAHFGRFRVVEISLGEGALAQFAREPMLAAAELLADARVDAIVWNGTSGGWLGLDHDAGLCRSIEERTGIRATTSVLALVEAVRATAASRLGLVTPYVDEVQERIVATLEAAGIEVVAERHLGISENHAFASVPAEKLRRMTLEVAAVAPDAITTFCTNLRAAPLVPALEAETGIPVYDTVSLGVWHGLALAGVDPGLVTGWGRLFAQSR